MQPSERSKESELNDFNVDKINNEDYKQAKTEAYKILDNNNNINNHNVNISRFTPKNFANSAIISPLKHSFHSDFTKSIIKNTANK